MFRKLRAFYSGNFTIGDRLGELFYAVWMVSITIGILNSYRVITPDVIWDVIFLAFGVNIVWGIIDGVTVMYTNIIEQAKRDEMVYDLRATHGGDAARENARSHLEETIIASLEPAAEEKILDAIAAGEAGADPHRKRYRPAKQDWMWALGIVLIDTTLVVPLVAPLLVFGHVETAVFVSRLIATLIFAAVGAAYARNLNRNPWIAGLIVGVLGFAVFTAAYAAGW